jgi:Txe/YoeB family toxin of toxin-antitoxin system
MLRRADLWNKVTVLLDVLRQNPFQNPPPYEKLQNEFRGIYSRRINRQHRLVYQVNKETKTVRILQMWTHYE